MTDIQHIPVNDGCRIACEYRPRNGSDVLVLSPSLGTAIGLFDAQVEALSASFGILRYDPRGHGASDVPEGSYSLDRLGSDVIGLMDALGIERAHFAGVSLGGMTGQWLGYRAPERLLSLTLANTSAYMGPPAGWAERINNVLANGMTAMVDAVLDRWFTPGFRASETAKVQRIAEMLLATDRRGYAGCSAAIRDMDLRPTAPLIAAPTLVISGAQDPATPPEHAEFLANRISGAQLVSLEAAHLSNVEQADAFTAALLAFIGSQ